MSPEARPLAWPFLLGVYKYKSAAGVAAGDESDDKHADKACRARLDALLRVASERLRARDEALLSDLRQLAVDTPRTDPHLLTIRSVMGRAALNRLLLAYSVSENSAGLYQGMGDLLVPFLLVFLPCSQHVAPSSAATVAMAELEGDSLELADAAGMPSSRAEALAYACFEALLVAQAPVFRGNYAAVGVHASAVAAIVRAEDPPLQAALAAAGAEYSTIALRPLLCMLRRELSVEDCCVVWEALWAARPPQAHTSRPEGWGGAAVLTAALLLSQREALLSCSTSLDLLEHMLNKTPGSEDPLELGIRVQQLAAAHSDRIQDTLSPPTQANPKP